MLEKLNAQEFAKVLKEMEADLEETFVSEYLSWILCVIEMRDAKFKKKVLEAFSQLS